MLTKPATMTRSAPWADAVTVPGPDISTRSTFWLSRAAAAVELPRIRLSSASMPFWAKYPPSLAAQSGACVAATATHAPRTFSVGPVLAAGEVRADAEAGAGAAPPQALSSRPSPATASARATVGAVDAGSRRAQPAFADGPKPPDTHNAALLFMQAAFYGLAQSLGLRSSDAELMQ